MGKNTISDDEDEYGYGEDEEEREPVDGDELEGREGDDDEEEEEEGQDEYEKDDFIVDDVDEEEQDEEEEREDSDEERHKKKKKKKKRENTGDELDEDDYILLEDNNAIQRRRKDKHRFKRLKKGRRDLDEDGFGLSDEELDDSGRGGRTDEEKVKRALFDDVEGQLEDIGEGDEPEEDEDEMEFGDGAEEDEMADFIVDEYADDGGSLRRKQLKRKRPRQGVSSLAMQEANDLFGDVEEYLRLRKRGLESDEWSGRTLDRDFEPTVLSEKYMTEKDEQIRSFDVPERLQIFEESYGSPSKELIQQCAAWICSQLANGVVPFFGQRGSEVAQQGQELPNSTELKLDIVQFLELRHIQKLDVPFIFMYRKEQCPILLKDPEQLEVDYDGQAPDRPPMLRWHKVLWAILELERKWLLLQKRKTALHSYYTKRFDEETRRIYDETRLNLNQQLFESICASLGHAESEREVDDVDAKFNLHFPQGEAGLDEGQYKRPKRKSLYSICCKAGLWEVARKFGWSSEQLGMHLSLVELPKGELENPKETPEEMAANFTCAMFETPQAVLKGARHMAAVEISCEPSVRKYVRTFYMQNALVSTSPTPDGNAAIDSFHQFAEVKWLREKPIQEFRDAQWLLIQKAEEEKLLHVTFKLPEEAMKKLVGDFEDQYVSFAVSKSAKLWDEQRKMILQDALYGFLLPSMEKEARSFSTSKAKNWLLWDYGKVLWEKVSVAPYQRKDNDVSSDDESTKVMACCWGPGKPATTFVMLDSSGEVLDVLQTGSLTSGSQNVENDQRKKTDQQRLLKFMMDNQPHVVVLGAANLSCTKLKDYIYEIIFKMVEDNPRDVGHEMDELSIVYGDESLPRLYENSRISSDQLPGQSGIVKRAVALGRYLQNPLAMAATLCGPWKEILSWNLSPLENFLTPDEKYSMIDQVMIDVTNQVGLDVNLAASHEWLFAPLQFISGFGPRKAASFQRSLVRTGSIYSRKDLFKHIDRRVFINAAGFLRVRASGNAASGSEYIDLLDDTRIHPESYNLAEDMALDVYERYNGETDRNDPSNAARELAIDYVSRNPNHLRSLDLDKYPRDRQDKKKETFKDIKRELMEGFQDWRRPFKELSQDEEFYMISGETEDTLAEGRIVQATVRRFQGNKAICILESGLTGILTKEDYSDDWRDIPELSDRLHEGDILTCKIKSIQKSRYQVLLVCRESEMRNDRYQQARNFDRYYQEDRNSVQSEQEKTHKEKELAKKHFKPRMIVHPRFQNITADEAMAFLSDKDPGESIIRPSSRGPSYLTLTLKVYDGVYAHKDIVEGGKEHKDITSLLRIGKTLKIGEDTFEDLDEVMDRYVDPLVAHLKAMLNYRKFRRGTKAEVDELLRIEKSEYPTRIVYSFGISHEHPGTFILTYIRSTNPHHEYVGLYPKGFKFRKRMFEDIDRLVAYFQRHIDDPLHESAPSIRSVAAMVPMRSPATGGTSGALSGGNWGGASNEAGWRGQSFDRDRSRTGRNDYRSGGSRDGHPSGLPRPFGGRGHGQGSFNNNRGNSVGNDRHGSGYDNLKWDSGTKDRDEGWGSGWGSGSRGGGGNSWSGGGGDGGGWGQGSGGGTEHGNTGWSSGSNRGSSHSQAGSGWSGGGGSGGGGGGSSGGGSSGGGSGW